MEHSTDDCSFAHLAARASASSYLELQALLNSLPRNDDPTRKKLLLHFALRARHRLARLLVATRWLRDHGHLAAHALVAEDTAEAHAASFDDVVDALWNVHARVHAHAAPRTAVSSAVDILTATPPARQSRSLAPAGPPRSDAPASSLAAQKPMLASDVSEVTQELPSSPYAILYVGRNALKQDAAVSPTVADRLGIATRNCIRESLLHLGALQVLKWRAGIADVCVRVGVPNLWTADLSLDSLDPHAAQLRAHAISIMVANHIDAPDAAPTNASLKVSKTAGKTGVLPVATDSTTAAAGEASFPETAQRTTSAQEAVLRRVADDRMSAALRAARAIAKGQGSFNPTCIMLCALRDMMMDDVCAPLAMDNLRAQATALSSSRWAGFLHVEGGSPVAPRSQPLTIHYWLNSRQPCSIRIGEFRAATPAPTTEASPVGSEENETLESTAEVTLERRPMCVNCVHTPPLPGAVELGGAYNPLELEMHDLSLESVLLQSIKLRVHARLKSLSEGFLRKRESLRIHASCVVLSRASQPSTRPRDAVKDCSDEESLRIQLGGQDGLDLRIYAMTGGLRIRPYGAAALTMRVQRFEDFSSSTVVKNLGSETEELDAAIMAFEAIRARVKLNAAARSVCALDIGVSNTLPPGTASVAAMASPDRAASQLVPPFAPLERRAPRRFLTLSPPPPAKSMLGSLQNGGSSPYQSMSRTSGSRGLERVGPTKRPRLTYATTSDALVFIQESSFAGEDWQVRTRGSESKSKATLGSQIVAEADSVDRYSGTAAAAAAWAVTRDVVERRLRRDSLLRAFVAANVASAAQMHHLKASEDGDLHLESASRVLLKVKCEPLPVRRAELLLRGYDAWQVRLSLLPKIFDSTDPMSTRGKRGNHERENSRGDGNLWSVGVACTGSQLTFTYPSANAASVRSFFRDLTRARTAAALARGVPQSPFYRVLRRSPVRIVVGIGPYNSPTENPVRNLTRGASEEEAHPAPLYTATVEYVYSKGNSGGFSLSFSPSKQTMEQLAPLIEEALDASGGQVGGILAGLLERACPVAAAAESAVRERGNGGIRFVTALRVRAVFPGFRGSALRDSGHGQPVHFQGKPCAPSGQVRHAVDVDARGGSGLVTVIDVGRATAVMIQHGFAQRSGSSGGGSSQRRNDFVPLPKWDQIVAALTKDGYAEAQRAESTVVLRMELLEQFLSELVTSAQNW